MDTRQIKWESPPFIDLPSSFINDLNSFNISSLENFIPQLLWNRNIRTLDQLKNFLDFSSYESISILEIWNEAIPSIHRLKTAIENKEKVMICGREGINNIIGTSLLWEGLGNFLIPYIQINYYIPSYSTKCHGFNNAMIRQLAIEEVSLIISCGVKDFNLQDITYAKSLGIDIIAIGRNININNLHDTLYTIDSCSLSENHPFFDLSETPLAYKLIEALHIKISNIPNNNLDSLLDLVAINSISTLLTSNTELRYLTKKGIQNLEKQLKNPSRPGIAYLLYLCKLSGSRPTDIYSGIGSRINSICCVNKSSSFLVELLTNKNKDYSEKLALEAELSNIRCNNLLQHIIRNIRQTLKDVDLLTTQVIVLEDPEWESEILRLIVQEVSREYDKPTILLTNAECKESKQQNLIFSKGYAFSSNNVNTYKLISSQRDLLYSFYGEEHSNLIDLSLKTENVSLFRDRVNQYLRQEFVEINIVQSIIKADLTVTVSQLGQSLFRELKILEPYSINNLIPKLLIKNCHLKISKSRNRKHVKNNTLKYIKAEFTIYDSSSTEGFSGVWWGHSREELQVKEDKKFDVIVELSYNNLQPENYEIRLVEMREISHSHNLSTIKKTKIKLLDYRNNNKVIPNSMENESVNICPVDWLELLRLYDKSCKNQQSLVLSYSHSIDSSSMSTIQKAIDIANFLSCNDKKITRKNLQEILSLSDFSLTLTLSFLEKFGFLINKNNERLSFHAVINTNSQYKVLLQKLTEVIEEENFKKRYFIQIPIEILEQILAHGSP